MSSGRHNHLIDLTGRRFNRLLVIRRDVNIGPQPTWLCRCDCGTEKVVRGYALRSGGTQSCGCGQREAASRVLTSHGLSKTPEYRVYQAMKRRCYLEHSRDWADYGGRGITVCDRWRRSFAAFIEDVGRRPRSDYQLDRIDTQGNYEPTNVRWVSALVNNGNRRCSRKGRSARWYELNSAGSLAFT